MVGPTISSPCLVCGGEALFNSISRGFLHSCPKNCPPHEVIAAARAIAERHQRDPEPLTDLHEFASAVLAATPPTARW